MKKILFITDFFGPDPGGMENFNTGLVHGQDGIVVLVTAPVLSDGAKRRSFDEAMGSPIYRISVPVPKILVPGPVRNREYATRFQHLLNRERPHHILLGNLYGRTAGLVPQIYRSGIPYSVILQPSDLDQLSMLHLKMHRFLTKAQNVFVFSNYFHELAIMKGLRGENIVSVPFGLHARWDRRLIRRARSRIMDRLKDVESRFRILSMGPLTRDKNIDRIFHVIEQLDDMGIDRNSYAWIIGGSGPEYGYLKELIALHKLEKTVFLAGFLEDLEVGALYYFSDLYFHPGGQPQNQASGYSASLLEAGYTSLPTVSGYGAGVDEIIRHQITGILHRADDYEGLARSIINLSRDADLRRKMGRFAEDRVLTEYDIERTRHQILLRL